MTSVSLVEILKKIGLVRINGMKIILYGDVRWDGALVFFDSKDQDRMSFGIKDGKICVYDADGGIWWGDSTAQVLETLHLISGLKDKGAAVWCSDGEYFDLRQFKQRTQDPFCEIR